MIEVCALISKNYTVLENIDRIESFIYMKDSVSMIQ